MKLLKRKDSLTFKREKPLAKQERIYLGMQAVRTVGEGLLRPSRGSTARVAPLPMLSGPHRAPLQLTSTRRSRRISRDHSRLAGPWARLRINLAAMPWVFETPRYMAPDTSYKPNHGQPSQKVPHRAAGSVLVETSLSKPHENRQHRHRNCLAASQSLIL